MRPQIKSRTTKIFVAFLSATTLLSMSNLADAAALTIIGASSTLGLLFLPLVPDRFSELTLVTGPTDRSWSSVRDALPPRFREGGECRGRVTLMCYDDSFVDIPAKPCDTLLFITPPSAFQSYPSAVSHAISAASQAVLISSAGVYGSASGVVTCVTPLPPKDTMSDRQLRIHSGEEPVLSHGCGVVLRLSGLWTPGRGPHRFWMEGGAVRGDPDGTINLVHYEDVAEAVRRVLINLEGVDSVEEEDRVCLVSDGAEVPCTRRRVCEVAGED